LILLLNLFYDRSLDTNSFFLFLLNLQVNLANGWTSLNGLRFRDNFGNYEFVILVLLLQFLLGLEV
jgi:hypothetical protein